MQTLTDSLSCRTCYRGPVTWSVYTAGQTLARIEEVMERDTFMTAEEARAFGLVDHVIDRRPTEQVFGGGVDEGAKP